MSHGPSEDKSQGTPHVCHATSGKAMVPALRMFAYGIVSLCASYIAANYLSHWWGWPALVDFIESGGGGPATGWVQLLVYALPLVAAAVYVRRTPGRALHEDSESFSDFTAFFIRGAFWAVLLIGIVDVTISFLRIEGFLDDIVGKSLTTELGRPAFRGQYVHYPVLAISFVIAYFTRSLGFHWLALLIVAAEVQIVIARFIFSYEQAFLADLVRFWYGALFLFSSAYTLIAEGHVRVDIIYTGFSERGKAWTNTLGSLFLGIPFCWVILTMGFWGKSNVITGPLLSYEVTQSGYGLYVKYLLAGYLLIFAISMLVEFTSYLLRNAAVLLHEPDYHPDLEEHAKI